MRLIYKIPIESEGCRPFIERNQGTRLMIGTNKISCDFEFIANLPDGKWVIERYDKKTVTLKKEE